MLRVSRAWMAPLPGFVHQMRRAVHHVRGGTTRPQPRHRDPGSEGLGVLGRSVSSSRASGREGSLFEPSLNMDIGRPKGQKVGFGKVSNWTKCALSVAESGAKGRRKIREFNKQ